ncbi:MAG: hypothetical protein K5663_11250 [Clostridiales bacterium]|nr:hypothetical protein [Clostridiales bacterium]
MRLIDADALINEKARYYSVIDGLNPEYEPTNCEGALRCAHTRVIRAVRTKDIREYPTIEAEPVVRCKDCKYGQYEEWDNGECVDKTVYCDGYGIHKPDWYCADGERREE